MAWWDHIQKCNTCGDTYQPETYKSRYCSSKCRQKAYRDRKRKTVTVSQVKRNAKRDPNRNAQIGGA